VQAGYRGDCHVSGRQVGGLQGISPGPVGQGQVGLLTEPGLPGPGVCLAGGPPSVGEFGRGRGSSQILGQQRAVLVGPDQYGCRGVAAAPVLGTGRQADPEVGGHHQSAVARGQGGAKGSDRRSGRSAEVQGRDRGVQA